MKIAADCYHLLACRRATANSKLQPLFVLLNLDVGFDGLRKVLVVGATQPHTLLLLREQNQIVSIALIKMCKQGASHQTQAESIFLSDGMCHWSPVIAQRLSNEVTPALN